jgi:hypothetical protein
MDKLKCQTSHAAAPAGAAARRGIHAPRRYAKLPLRRGCGVASRGNRRGIVEAGAPRGAPGRQRARSVWPARRRRAASGKAGVIRRPLGIAVGPSRSPRGDPRSDKAACMDESNGCRWPGRCGISRWELLAYSLSQTRVLTSQAVSRLRKHEFAILGGRPAQRGLLGGQACAGLDGLTRAVRSGLSRRCPRSRRFRHSD